MRVKIYYDAEAYEGNELGFMHISQPTRRLWLMSLVLLLAAGLRLVHWQDAPPGLQHDEVYYAHDGFLAATQGDWRLYYPNNQGREGAYIWLLGGAYQLFGANWALVKFPPLAFGLLTVALLYAVLGRLFGWRVGLLAALSFAVSFWGLFTGRMGLRAVTLPVFALALAWGMWHLLYLPRPRWRVALLTGGILGATLYTYTSAFVVYGALGVALVGVALTQWARLRARWRHILLALSLGAVLALPMVYVRLTTSDGLTRVEKITRPWTDFLAGKPQELLDNAGKLALMLAYTGDPEWRYNVAERPFFPVVLGLLAYAGVVLLVRSCRRQPFHAYFVALLCLGIVPSLLTVAAPSFLRSIVALVPVAYLALALALVAMMDGLQRWLNLGWWVWCIPALSVGALALIDVDAYFGQWANHEEVYAIYRDDLQQLAANLRQSDLEGIQVIVSTPNVELDPLTYRYENPPAQRVTFFSGMTNIVLSDQPALLLISALSPITEPHQDWLSEANGTRYEGEILRQDGQVAYQIYRLNATRNIVAERLAQYQTPVYLAPARADIASDYAEREMRLNYPINFGNQLALIALDLPRATFFTTQDGINMQLYLRPLVSQTGQALQVFAHLSKPDGTLVAQRDLMGVAPAQWQTDQFFIQDNFIVAGPQDQGDYIVTMGVYDLNSQARLPILAEDGTPLGDRLILGRVRAVPR